MTTQDQLDQSQIEIMEAYSRVFTSPDGEIVLDDMERAYSRSTTFVPGDTHHSARKEGKRCVLLDIYAMIEKIEELRKPGASKLPDNYAEDCDAR